jgi:MFS superfamily sulfate permease-like transporter
MSLPQQQNTKAAGSRLRFVLAEAAGGLGDLGTFVPIVVGMVQLVGLDAATILVFAGLMNILSGLAFGIPIAVQPMKAVCALAIAGALTAPQVGVAGLAVGASMLALGGLGLIRWLDRLVPRPVLHGIQVAVGAKLLLSGAQLGLFDRAAERLRSPWGAEGLVVGLLALGVVLLLRRRLTWAALSLTALGLVAACIRHPALFENVGVQLWQPRLAVFGAGSLKGLWDGAVAQFPLTLLNSVLVVSVLAARLYPEHSRRSRPTRIAVSVGLMNLVACPLGGMPMCHGSGGLAAQHQFGARTGLSMVMLGALKLCIGLLFGGAAVAVMTAFPATVLGAFLLIAGFGLARASQFWRTRLGVLTAVVAVGVHQVSGALALAVLAAWGLCLVIPREWGQEAFLPARWQDAVGWAGSSRGE